MNSSSKNTLINFLLPELEHLNENLWNKKIRNFEVDILLPFIPSNLKYFSLNSDYCNDQIVLKSLQNKQEDFTERYGKLNFV